jgi:NTE family protein
MNQGLVLSGGGAFGAYEVGVLKALLRGESATTKYQPLSPDAISGTSGGGFNAAVVMSKLHEGGSSAIRHLEEIWLNHVASAALTTCGNGVFRLRGNPTNYLNPGCYVPNPLRPLVDFARDTSALAMDGVRRIRHAIQFNERIEQRILEQISFEPLIDVQPFRNLVREVITYENIRDSPVKLAINATNWDRGTVRFFQNSDFTPEFGPRVISAAASIPGIFPPHEIDGDRYVDGSVLVNSPLRVTIREGIDELHVVTHLPLGADMPWPHFANLPEVNWRLQEIKWAATLRQDIGYARNINEGLEFLEKEGWAPPGSRSSDRSFVRVAKGIRQRGDEELPYRKLDIHLYYPQQALGGLLGFLDFEKHALSKYIQQGYQETLKHDCQINQCVLIDRDSTLAPREHNTVSVS